MKKVLSRCVICKRLEGKVYGVLRSIVLLEFRVKEVFLFFKVGVDFAGLVYVKALIGGMKKVYIALFFCCVIRVLYLEFVEDLSVEIFT